MNTFKQRITPVSFIYGSLFLLVAVIYALVQWVTAVSASCDLPIIPPGPDEFAFTRSVLDPDLEPVECVEVIAISGATSVTTTTGADGRFHLALPTNNSYDIVFNPPVVEIGGRYLASHILHGVNETSADAIPDPIELSSGFLISGTVYGDSAHTVPVPFAEIYAFNIDTNDRMGLPEADAAGHYAIVLEPGTWELTFNPPPFQGYSQRHLAPIELTTNPVPLDITLPAGFTIHGTISNPDGTVAANVEIYAQAPSETTGHGFTPSGAEGIYAGSVPSGTFEIQYLPPPFSGAGSTVVTDISGPPDREVNVLLPAGHTVYGSVSKCGAGIANAFIFAAPHSSIITGHFFGGWGRFAGSDGSYGIALQPALYTIIVVPPPMTGLDNIELPGIRLSADTNLDFEFACEDIPDAACDPEAPGAILGTDEKDVLIGTPGNDVIIGYDGNDRIFAWGGDDCIDGGRGNDLIRGHRGHDRIFGGAGNDLLNGGSGDDRVWGNNGNDKLQGESGDDTLNGGAGWDRLNGRSGHDHCTNGEITKRCES